MQEELILEEKDMMDYVVRNNENINKERIKYLIKSFLINTPKIKDFETTISDISNNEWEKYKRKFSNNFVNIFNKICSELREYKDFEDAYSNLYFVSIMKRTLGDKFEILFDAMEDYHYIYHSDISNKEAANEENLNTIANLSALYIAKQKEEFKKKFKENIYEDLKYYYTINKNSEVLKKNIDYVKRRELLKTMTKENNSDIESLIKELYNQYKKEIPEDLFYSMISKFIFNDSSKISDIIKEPIDYKEYEMYKKAVKLVKRINLGNITIESPEVRNYLDIIYFDHKENIYKCFDFEYGNDAYEYYDKYKDIFNNIKSAFIKKINTFNVDDIELDKEVIEEISHNLPFNDENFIFNLKKVIEDINLKAFAKLVNCSNEKNYEDLYKLLIEDKYLWIYIMLSLTSNKLDFKLETTIKNIDSIIRLSKLLNLELDSTKNISLLTKISKCSGDYEVSIVGLKNIEKILNSNTKLWGSVYSNIENAVDLISNMSLRSNSTVPFISGKKGYYKYSLYDFLDRDVLSCGIDTNSCFRLGGKDNDFLRYCALDKNGFVIKITDLNDNFVAKVSGFRNGNTVFLNQLRTIYDKAGFGYDSGYDAEKYEIIETFKEACNDIVKYSNEEEKIDFVIITKSFLLKDIKSNVDDKILKKIGLYPMDNKSDDWINFKENTSYIKDTVNKDYFITDYGYYPLICMAKNKELNVNNIEFYDAFPIYKRKRNEIVFEKCSKNILEEINRINGIKYYLNNDLSIPYNNIEYTNDYYVIKGDNWYIIMNYEYEIVDSCVIEEDLEAKKEYDIIYEKYQKGKNKSLK